MKDEERIKWTFFIGLNETDTVKKPKINLKFRDSSLRFAFRYESKSD